MNKFDAIMYIMFLLSVILRFSLCKDNFIWARMTYSITLAFFILRTLQFFFLCCKEYWTEDYHDRKNGQESSTCTMEPSDYKNGTLPGCPESTALVPLVLAVYMVLANLLLLNLLIAIFSNTFQKVQDNAVLVWKFHRYSLVHEYYERPVLAQPLIIINHLYRAGYFVYPKWCKKDFKLDNAFEVDMQERDKVVVEFETKAMDDCFKSLDDRHGSKVQRTRSYYHMTNDNIERDDKLKEIAELCNQVNQKLTELVESTA